MDLAYKYGGGAAPRRRYGVHQISVRYRRPGQADVPPRACICSRDGPTPLGDGLRHDFGGRIQALWWQRAARSRPIKGVLTVGHPALLVGLA